jgi:RNA polymerase sigma factor (sigma-70 family)
MTPTPSDADLIAQCLDGRDTAWSLLVERYSGLIYSVALKYGLSRDDAAEVFQNVCLLWWQSLNSLRNTERLSSWLITVTARTAWRTIAGRRRVRDHEAEDGDERVGLVAAHDPLPEEIVLQTERASALRQAVSQLDERCQELIELLFFVDETPDYAAIAHHFGLAEGSIGALRKRCLERLKREMMKSSRAGAFSDVH